MPLWDSVQQIQSCWPLSSFLHWKLRFHPSVLAQGIMRGSNFGIGDGFRSILRDMAEKKTDRCACRFTVQQAKDGKPCLAVHLYRDTIPVLRELSFGFDLLRGTQVEDAKKLAEMLNEHVLDMFVTKDKAV